LNLFYQPGIPEGITHLDAEESRHAVRVLRMAEGDPLSLTDGKGFLYSAKVTRADSKKCGFEISGKREIRKRDFFIHIAIAPTKNADRIEWFVEKALEIGVDEISFMLCRNSERKVINTERIEKIAISALKQSQQAWMPTIHAITPFKEVLGFKGDQKFIAYVDESNPTHLQSVAVRGKKYVVLIGPEGDFTGEELQQAGENGFKKISLGPHRLRTETAGLAACQILNLLQLK